MLHHDAQVPDGLMPMVRSALAAAQSEGHHDTLPVWDAGWSKFSMLQTVMQLSKASRTVTTHSLQPLSDLHQNLVGRW
jgi:hypothetical protein